MEAEDQSMIPKGESPSFGTRLDYTKPQYRDLWCAVIYIIHLILIIAITAYLLPLAVDNINKNNNDPQQPQPEEIDFSGAIVVVISCAILGLLIGFMWLAVLKRFAMTVIKIMLYLNIAFWTILIIVGIATMQIGLAIVAIIMVLFWALYMYCCWQRIKFSSVLLSISSRIIEAFPGTVCVAISMVILSLIWIVIWLFCSGSYIMSNSTETVNADNGETEIQFNGSGFVVFLLFISLYWVIEVNSNVSHTTSCGVAASWYFTPSDQRMDGTKPAFKRSITTSFGSICMGSLIVAILQAIRAIISIAENKRDGNQLVLCLLKCCVICIQRCIEWFNTYAFAHCAIYGTSFIESAGATWQLLSSRGILALINDDLTGMALFAGSLISAVLCGLIGAGIAYPFYSNDSDIILVLGIYGAFAGLVLTLLVLSAVRSAIVCLFVCFAEEPAVLYENKRDEFNALSDVNPEIKGVYDKFGIQSV